MHTSGSSVLRFTNVLATALAWLALACAGNAAAMSLRELRALEKSDKQGEHYASYYLVGVMEGALDVQAHDVRNGAKPAICLNGRRLEPRMARSLFDTELKRNEGQYEADMPVSLVMVNALTTVYGCGG